MTPAERMCQKVAGLKSNSSGWVAKCPAHEDLVASLSITESADGKVLLHCHAGCSTISVLSALGMTLGELFPEDPSKKAKPEPKIYQYHDIDGKVSYEVCRFPPKDFRQRHRDPKNPSKWIWNMTGVKRLPYRLHQLVGVETAVIVEGEKDADRLWLEGIPATTNVGGATKWKSPETVAIKNAGVKRVIILPDNDAAGENHGVEVAARCKAAGIAVSIINLPGLPPKGDVSDWLTKCGHTVDELKALIQATPYVVPAGATATAEQPAPSPAQYQGSLWNRILGRLADTCDKASFERWLFNLKLLDQSGPDEGPEVVMVVGTPTAHGKDWLTRHYTAAFTAAAAYFGVVATFVFMVSLEPGTIEPGSYHLTDLGNAEAFRDRFGDLVRWDRLLEKWFVWDQHRWSCDDGGTKIRRLAHDHVRLWQQEASLLADYTVRKSVMDYAMRQEKAASFNTMLSELRVLDPVAASGNDWDQNPWLLGVANGIVDLRSGMLRDGDRFDNITKSVRCAYRPNAVAPRWLQFIDEIFGGDEELKAYIQRAVGYSLTGIISEQCFFMAHGSGSNGKSTLLATLDYVFQDYSHTTDIRTFTVGNDSVPYQLAQLVGRRLILTSEARKAAKMNEQVVKNFTGGEKVEVQHKYGHPFSFTPVGKLWFAVNHMPKVEDESHGFWRRVRAIPFLQTFQVTSEGMLLPGILKSEAEGILRWAVEGCLQWQQIGLKPPAAVVEATKLYQDEEDPINEFLLDRCQRGPELSVQASALYAAYRSWATQQGIPERDRMTGTAFGKHAARMFQVQRVATGRRYVGLGLVRGLDHDLYSDDEP